MKFIDPTERRGPAGPRLSRTQKVREIMAEKERARYVALKCGHMTDWDTIQLYADHAPNKGKEYCEHCGRWVKRKPKPPKPEYPDDPSVLF